MRPIRSILVPYDFSLYSEAALDMATELAARFDAELHLVHIVQPPAYAYSTELGLGGVMQSLGLHEAAEEKLQSVARGLRGSTPHIEVHVVEGTHVADRIDEVAASLGTDLIAMGTHGRTGLAHAILGSVAERTLRKAPCPVLTVPLRPQPVASTETTRTAGMPLAVPW